MTLSNDRMGLRDQLQTGRRELITRFRKSPPQTIGAGKLLAAGIKSRAAICHLVAGWACQSRAFSDGHQAILDIYLPGDVIGLDSVLRTRGLNNVLTLTSIAIEAIDAEDEMLDLMTCRSTVLYIAWLFGQRQQRAERLLGAISSLDARGRLAAMVLDFFERLTRQGLVTSRTYNLPLNQAHAKPRRSRANLRPPSRSACVIDRLRKNQNPLEKRNNLRSSPPHLVVDRRPENRAVILRSEISWTREPRPCQRSAFPVQTGMQGPLPRRALLCSGELVPRTLTISAHDHAPSQDCAWPRRRQHLAAKPSGATK